jgi:hypothetical protein
MARIKKFVQFCEEFPPPIATQPPTNVADGTKIAGLPPDLPPVPSRKKSKIVKRKLPKS